MDLRDRIKNQFGVKDVVARKLPGDFLGVDAPEPMPTRKPLNIRILSATEQEWKQRIHEKLLTVMDLAQISQLDAKQVSAQIRELTQRLMEEESAPINMGTRQYIAKLIEDDIVGLGLLEPLLAEASVSDILVNGYDKVYVERYGKLELTPIQFQSERHLRNVIDRIVNSVGRRCDESVPMVDARLQDGSRVNAIIPPLALDGSMLSIRRFNIDRLKIKDLIQFRSLTVAMAEFLSAAVKGRLNVIVSGGTGSGKTTLLNALSSFIPADERIITIEDAAELRLQQPHVGRLETRPPNIEGKGEITARDLVRNALRMRPDRIVIGEVRGEEAFDMLQAMNTGHDGSLTTVHANTPRDAFARIENMVAMAGFELPPQAIRNQIASGINLVVQVSRMEDGRRKLTNIAEITGMEGDVITMNDVFSFQRQGMDHQGNVLGRFRASGVLPKSVEYLSQRGIYLDIGIFDPHRGEYFDEEEAT
jgi:pilus assembly protein CpaF